MSVPRRELLQAAEQAVGQGRLGQAVRLLSGEAIHDVSGRRLAIDLHDQLVARCRLSIQSSAWIIAIDHLQWLRDLKGSQRPGRGFERSFRLRAESGRSHRPSLSDTKRSSRCMRPQCKLTLISLSLQILILTFLRFGAPRSLLRWADLQRQRVACESKLDQLVQPLDRLQRAS